MSGTRERDRDVVAEELGLLGAYGLSGERLVRNHGGKRAPRGSLGTIFFPPSLEAEEPEDGRLLTGRETVRMIVVASYCMSCINARIIRFYLRGYPHLPGYGYMAHLRRTILPAYGHVLATSTLHDRFKLGSDHRIETLAGDVVTELQAIVKMTWDERTEHMRNTNYKSRMRFARRVLSERKDGDRRHEALLDDTSPRYAPWAREAEERALHHERYCTEPERSAAPTE